MATQATSTIVPRSDLAKVFTDPRTLRAVEQALNSIQQILQAPLIVAVPTDIAGNAVVLTAGTGITIDLTTPGEVIIAATSTTITRATRFVGLLHADDDAAAAALGVQIGEAYLNGSVLQVRVA